MKTIIIIFRENIENTHESPRSNGFCGLGKLGAIAEGAAKADRRVRTKPL